MNTPLIPSFLLPSAALFAMAASTSAQTLNVVADTFTSGSSKTANYGSNTKVNIENGGSGLEKTRIGYFRFDTSSYIGGTIGGAEFTLYPFEQIATSEPQNFDIYGITDGGMSENFDESTLTWNNSGYAYSSSQNITNSINFDDLVSLGSITGVVPADEGGSVSLSSISLDTFLNSNENGVVTFIG